MDRSVCVCVWSKLPYIRHIPRTSHLAERLVRTQCSPTALWDYSQLLAVMIGWLWIRAPCQEEESCPSWLSWKPCPKRFLGRKKDRDRDGFDEGMAVCGVQNIKIGGQAWYFFTSQCKHSVADLFGFKTWHTFITFLHILFKQEICFSKWG